MKIPLIVHASPSIQDTPLVSIGRGRWIVESDCLDTEYSVLGVLGVHDIGMKFDLPDTTKVRVIITKPGTEKSINVWIRNEN